MKRYHLFEIEDQPWLPAFLRDYVTDYLQFVVTRQVPYRVLLPQLQEALQRTGATRVVDLCSGAGGSWPTLLPLVREMGIDTNLLLTDLYPNRSDAEDELRVRVAADARHVPVAGHVLRTIFAGLHHFPPEGAKAILRDATRAGHGILVVEGTSRSLLSILTVLVSALMVFLLTPLIPGRRLGRFFCTYVIPIVPLIVAFDGVISSLRTYTPDEMLALAREVAPTSYDWQTGQTPIPNTPLVVTWLLGVPLTLPPLQSDTALAPS